jgi:mannosyltransferase OCH1-like enzyme
MIPKTIHYCWFGGNPYPKTVNKCISTWKLNLPDYELKLWDETNSPMTHPFVKQAYKEKKYAFVADYVRLWALFNEGGIYLDTDMYVIKSLNKFLNEDTFFGYETKKCDYISAGVIGAQLNNDFIHKLLQAYDLLNFENNKLQNLKIPGIITSTYSLYDNKKLIKLFPFEYFYPFPYEKRNDKDEFINFKTDQTYAIHLWDKSWFTWKDYFILKCNNIVRKIYL